MNRAVLVRFLAALVALAAGVASLVVVVLLIRDTVG